MAGVPFKNRVMHKRYFKISFLNIRGLEKESIISIQYSRYNVDYKIRKECFTSIGKNLS